MFYARYNKNSMIVYGHHSMIVYGAVSGVRSHNENSPGYFCYTRTIIPFYY